MGLPHLFAQSKRSPRGRGAPRKRPRPLLRAEELEPRTVPTAQIAAHPTFRLASPSFNPGQSPAGYWPSQIRHAYGFDQLSLDGTGQTIAIVDAYHDPNLASDLATFDTQFNLPAPPSFKQVDQNGNSPTSVPTDPTGDWEVEETLDVEWAHAIAPKANILLVESSGPDNSLFTAVDTARNTPGVVAVSMSWGGGEFSGESSYDSYFTTPAGHPGVTFLASTGDNGTPSGYPALSPNVVGVGGTTLTLNSSDNPTGEVGWSGSGGSYSLYANEPTYQSNYAQSSYVLNTLGNKVLQGSPRGNPDVSYDADPSPGFAIYDTFANQYGLSGWFAIGGTSAGAPQWAALIALVDQGRGAAGPLDGPTQTLPALYQLGAGSASYGRDFVDITSGSNGLSAQAGYDLVTGLGSPRANNLVPDLENANGFTTLNITPSTTSPTAGTPFSITVTAQNASGQTITGYTGTVHFTTTDKGTGVVLPADYPFTAADNGTHTFTGVTLVTAGSQTLTAADTGNSSISGSANLTVAPASASTLTLTAPASSTQNASFSVTLTAKDTYGNTATGYRGTVHFTSSDTGTGVVLPGNYTFTSTDKGTHTFTGVTLVTVGPQTVKAADTGNSALAATATVQVVAPGSATLFKVSTPTSATAGTAFSITVTALDSNNNTATGYLGTVHFTSTDKSTGVILPGNYIFTAADHGTHTFTNGVTLIKAGSQKVTATDTKNSTLTGSGTVTVNGAAAKTLTVAGFPSPTTAGTSGSFTVTARDAYGNTATGYGGTITFTSTDPQAVLPGNATLSKGTGSFRATFNTVGTQSLTATDTVRSTITGTQTNITVQAPAVPPPSVIGIGPTSGPTSGGTQVYVYGSNFNGVTAVNFGGVPATIVVVSSTELSVLSPAHPAGTVDITVTTPAGTSALTPADQYTYVSSPPPSNAPVVQSVSPNSGPTSGGTQVFVYGSYFDGATAVDFGGVPATIQTVTSTEISVLSPAEAAGTVDVTVTTPAGTSALTSADQYTYVSSPPPPSAPVVQSVSPNSGPTNGGTQVFVYGSYFDGATAVDFGGVPATIQTVTSTEISVLSPAEAAGTVDITVTTPAGTSALTSADQYTYVSNPPSGAPTVIGIGPRSGPTSGGTQVYVYGTNLGGVTAVNFGGVPATIVVVSSSELSVLSPAHAAGTVDVTVTTPAGTSALTSADQYTYLGSSFSAVRARGPGRPSLPGSSPGRMNMAAVDALIAQWGGYAGGLPPQGSLLQEASAILGDSTFFHKKSDEGGTDLLTGWIF